MTTTLPQKIILKSTTTISLNDQFSQIETSKTLFNIGS